MLCYWLDYYIISNARITCIKGRHAIVPLCKVRTGLRCGCQWPCCVVTLLQGTALAARPSCPQHPRRVTLRQAGQHQPLLLHCARLQGAQRVLHSPLRHASSVIAASSSSAGFSRLSNMVAAPV